MPMSPLVPALLAGSGGEGAMFMDPATLAAQPELQLGQNLMTQGVSTAPAYPVQALARALSGAFGAGLFKSGASDLASAWGGSTQALEDIFPGDTPIGKAIRSSNPMVRMWGLQQAPKAMLLNSERFNLEPTQESHAMGSPSAAVVSGQPQSPQGRVVLDA